MRLGLICLHFVFEIDYYLCAMSLSIYFTQYLIYFTLFRHHVYISFPYSFLHCIFFALLIASLLIAYSSSSVTAIFSIHLQQPMPSHVCTNALHSFKSTHSPAALSLACLMDHWFSLPIYFISSICPYISLSLCVCIYDSLSLFL